MSEGTRTIHVDYLARVEGEGSLTIRLEGGGMDADLLGATGLDLDALEVQGP